MLVNTRELLQKAKQDGYAVGAFNAVNLESAKAIISVANELKSPVIVQTSTKSLDYAGFDELLSLIRLMGEKVKIPVAVHLDHGKEIDVVKYAIKKGLHTSIMYDGSGLEYSQNVRNTSRVVELGHKAGMTVEAELGAVGNKQSFTLSSSVYTDPAEAKKFVEKTGCDSLAVAFGNWHGEKIKGEKLNFDVLAAVSMQVDIPLVFHGASNSTFNEFTKAIKLGVAKINIDTELKQAFAQTLRRYLRTHLRVIDQREILLPTTQAIAKVVGERIKDFGSIGKAK